MKTLQDLKNLGVQELSVSNGQAVAVNPYEKSFVRMILGEFKQVINENYTDVDSLPPLPCSESVKEGRYSIDRFEEAFQVQDDDTREWTTVIKDDSCHWLNFNQRTVLILSEPVAECEAEYCTVAHSFVDSSGYCGIVGCTGDNHIMKKQELNEVAEKPGESGRLLGHIKYDFENQTETFTPYQPEAEPVESAEEESEALRVLEMHFGSEYWHFGPVEKKHIANAMREYASLRVAQALKK